MAHSPHCTQRLGSLLVVPLILAASCSRLPVAPTSQPGTVPSSARSSGVAMTGFGGGSFYPLGFGDRWQYQGTLSLVSYGAYPGPQGDTLAQLEFTEEHRIVGAEDREGWRYQVREERIVEPGTAGGETVSWSRLRQDRSGLYAADIDVTEPPTASGVAGSVPPAEAAAMAPEASLRATLAGGGIAGEPVTRLLKRLKIARAAARAGSGPRVGSGAASESELTWLRYPPHPGSAWDIRPDFPWPARVDRIEILDTPAGRMPAYRIETDPFGSTVGDGEWVRLWYGRSGYMGYSIHLVEPWTTTSVVVTDEQMLLVGTNARPGR